MRYWWAIFMILFSLPVQGSKLQIELQWDEQIAIYPQLSYQWRLNNYQLETTWGRDDTWGLLCGQAGVESGHFKLNFLYNRPHISFNDPFRLVSPGVRNDKEPAITLSTRWANQRLNFLYVHNHPHETGNLYGAHWNWSASRFRVGLAGIGQYDQVWHRGLASMHSTIFHHPWEINGAIGMGLDQETALVGSIGYGLARGHMTMGYQAISPHWKSWANWQDPYRHDRYGWFYTLSWQNHLGRILVGGENLKGWNVAHAYPQWHAEYRTPPLGNWRIRLRSEERTSGRRYQSDIYYGSWNLFFVSLEQDNRIGIRGPIMKGLRGTLGWQQREQRLRLQLDGQYYDWNIRLVGKKRELETTQYFYYLKVSNDRIYAQFGEYDRGRLDAYWNQEYGLRVGWKYSF